MYSTLITVSERLEDFCQFFSAGTLRSTSVEENQDSHIRASPTSLHSFTFCESTMGGTKLSAQEISRHNTPTDCWIVVDGQVWDVTDFHEQHPGGSASKDKAQLCL